MHSDFSPALWKAQLERWRRSGVQPFIADGGDGSAGRPGFRAGHYPMTAQEIRRST